MKPSKNLGLVALFFIIFSSVFVSNVYASGSKMPEVSDVPGGGFGETPGLAPDEYLNVSTAIGSSVDNYKGSSQLTKTRTLINTDAVDKCSAGNNDQFSDQISQSVAGMLNDTPAMVASVGSSYGTSSNESEYSPVSLMRHPLCTVSSSSLSKTLKKVPAQSTIDKANRFAAKVNKLRAASLMGDGAAKAELLSTWTKLYSCLAYSESLNSSDSARSKSVAAKYAPSDYKKPTGVEFYEDPLQDAVSRLNIGMFQFTPNSSGNIKSCLKAWNALKGNSCQVPTSGSQADMIRIVGSSGQSFNAFCGVHKLIETFSIQVNTKNAGSTDPSNMEGGKLKSAANRCVTPHFYAGKAYNHFGPFQNSTGSNMGELFSCIENS